MKRIISLFTLLLIIGSVYAPFYATAKPTESLSISALGEASLSKWGGESSLKVKPTDAVSMIGGKLKTSANIEVKVDQRADGFEYSWILASRPTSNVFSLTLTYSGCSFYYQPPLNAGTYPLGWVATETQVFDDKGKLMESRPIDVVGSYAVYGEQRNGVYGTGKVAHIYRPQVTDAAGKKTWGVMSIVGNILSVTVDQKWLDAAKYPVVVDPTFGTTGIGASTETISAGQAYGTLVTTPTANSVVVTKITAYIDDNGGSGSAWFRGSIWANSNGGAVIGSAAYPNGVIPGAYAWSDNSFTAALTLAASTNYILGIQIATNTARIKYDTGTGGTGHRDVSNFAATPGAFDWTASNDYIYSLYATYYSAPTITSSVISDMDDTDNVYTMKKYYTFTTVIADSNGGADITSISVRAAQGATVRWMVNATTLPTYTLVTGANTTDLNAAACTWTPTATNGTLTLLIRAEWDATNENDLELAVWARDAAGHTVGWTTVHTNYFDVISRLVTRDFTGNVTSTTINMPVLITGRVRYATTTTGNNASVSYPPDAQFTAVKLYTGGGDYAGADAAIVNGFYNITVTTPTVLGTIYYYTWLDMAGDYTDGYAVNADYVAVSVTPAFGVVSVIPQGFTFFGADLTQVFLIITAFTAWFTASATALIGMIFGVMTLIIYISGEIINWTTRMANFFVALLTFISSIFSGTVGGHNVWTEFNIAAWIDFIPVLAFIIWYGGLEVRAKRGGVSTHELLLRDLQVASWIIGEVWSWTFTVFNFVANMIMSFVGAFLP